MGNDELAQHLKSLQRESCYRIDALLKESPVEITQRVFFVGNNGAESGPFIRKFIKRDFGVGAAYERIFAAQQRGHRFKYIPDVLECYTRGDELVVVMELVRGQTLQDAVYERDPSVQLASAVFPKLCDAVGELHTEFVPPIIHRDLKPSNVILTGEGIALIDFGISREYDEDAVTDTMHFGTREFAPPEQYGFGQTGVYSDIYSLGMVLYFCLTEEIPNAQARKQGFRHANIPEELRQVIEHAVALDPAARFASTGELKDAFSAAAEKLTSPKPSGKGATDSGSKAGKGIPATANERAPRRGKPIGILAAAVVACLVLVAVFTLGSARNADDRQADSGKSSSPATAASDSSAPGDDSPANAVSSETASDAAAQAASGEATVEQRELAEDLENHAEPKNGFDPATNFTVEVAGVEFQIPSYFLTKTGTGDNGALYYYAESGSAVAMIMTQETFIDANAGRTDFENAKDDYLTGLMENEELEELTASTDCELAGLPARVVSITGTAKGLRTTNKIAYFFNPDMHVLGAIMFGQTTNTQFDYSLDFAKVITSAK